MKVKVRKIEAPYHDVPTESLQAILRNHAHDRLMVRIGTEQLYAIMEELVHRDEAAGKRVQAPGEAEFVKRWLEATMECSQAILQQRQHRVPKELTPSLGGGECLGNGHWPGYECQCPDCDWYATVCFPDWQDATPY